MEHFEPDSPEFTYDEFGYFDENRDEFGISGNASPALERVQMETSAGSVSALRWGTGRPRTVMIHGTAQNAHTWDTVMLALGEPSALVVDLPGHGRSQWREDARYDPHTNAGTLIEALTRVLDGPVVVVGMSLGGLTANRMAADAPELVSRLVVVDITPGVTSEKARDIHKFIAGPQSFGSFEEIFERTVEFNPTRTEASLRRGILHNAHREPGGTWRWNYHRAVPDDADFMSREALWSDISASRVPYLLVRGGDSPVTDDADVAELLERRPDAVVQVVEGAGHSIQGDRPVELARIIDAEMGEAADGGSGR